MQLFLKLLLVLVAAADAAVFFQLRKRIKSWERYVDGPLPDGEEAYVQGRIKLIGILSAAATLLLLINLLL